MLAFRGVKPVFQSSFHDLESPLWHTCSSFSLVTMITNDEEMIYWLCTMINKPSASRLIAHKLFVECYIDAFHSSILHSTWARTQRELFCVIFYLQHFELHSSCSANNVKALRIIVIHSLHNSRVATPSFQQLKKLFSSDLMVGLEHVVKWLKSSNQSSRSVSCWEKQSGI